jgi:hypothetical protein
MILLEILPILFLYITIAFLVHGYASSQFEDNSNLFELDKKVFSIILAVFFPLYLLWKFISFIVIPAKHLGYKIGKRQLENKKKRIQLQEKLRIEMRDAELELEKQFQDLDLVEKLNASDWTKRKPPLTKAIPAKRSYKKKV